MIDFIRRRLVMEDKPVASRQTARQHPLRNALIAMFLALLELVRLQAILLRQDRNFSEIFVKKHEQFEQALNERMSSDSRRLVRRELRSTARSSRPIHSNIHKLWLEIHARGSTPPVSFWNALPRRFQEPIPWIEASSVASSPGRPAGGTSSVHEKLNKSPGKIGMIIFGLVLIGGFGYAGSQLAHDLSGTHLASVWPYLLLGLALLIALGFEFVNGFHDTANAVATVIYTHSLEPHIAVVWSGMWNLIGVLTSSGAVAFTIISLLPVELILQVGKGAGFAMVFALLIAAIIWNLSTWWFGLPASSSHTLIGSIIGVGVANQLMSPKSRHQRRGLGSGRAASSKCCCFSPVVGFVLAALLLLLLKVLVKNPELYKAPKGDAPPPFWIRGLLILTCTRRQLRPWLQRRPEGHGPDHAHPDRNRSHRLRSESRRRPQPGAGFRGSLPAGGNVFASHVSPDAVIERCRAAT